MFVSSGCKSGRPNVGLVPSGLDAANLAQSTQRWQRPKPGEIPEFRTAAFFMLHA
jgi:hypothetical protein